LSPVLDNVLKIILDNSSIKPFTFFSEIEAKGAKVNGSDYTYVKQNTIFV